MSNIDRGKVGLFDRVESNTEEMYTEADRLYYAIRYRNGDNEEKLVAVDRIEQCNELRDLLVTIVYTEESLDALELHRGL